MNDDGFREIQLNGKQLVFLFMAATVVSVVIFLCGVLVGRGVRPERVAGPEAAATEISADGGATAQSPRGGGPGAASGTSLSGPGAPPAPIDELSYPDRLQRNTPPQETLKLAPPVQERVPAQPAKPGAAKPSSPPAPSSTATLSDPSGPGYAVQVAISKDRREADTLAKQLIAKGYPAFVMDPAEGAPPGIYRVRVGKYKDRRDAEAVASRLKTVELFDPWIAR